MKSLLCVAFGFSLTFSCVSSFGACDHAHHLFFIQRSKNGNIVRYDVCTTKDGNLVGEAPVFVYWVLENGERSDLNSIQKKVAYGIASQKRLEPNRYDIVLQALKEKKITVQKTHNGYRAFVMIDGRQSILERVYVESQERWGLPKVLFIDLFGRDGQTNLPVVERIFPT
jgi:hypothetical protein